MRLRRLVPALPALALTLAALIGSEARAQTIPSPYRFIDTRQEAGLFAGGNFIVGEGQYGIGPKPGPMIGARYGITIGGPFSLDGVVTYADTERDVKDPDEEGNLTTIGQAPMQLLTIDARIKFNVLGTRTWHKIAPFFLAGAGITFDLAGQSALDQQLLPEDRYDFGNSFAGILGAGTRWFPTERFSFRADLALQLWQQDIPAGYPLRPLLFDAPNSEWIQAWGLTFGAAYNF